MIDRLGGLRLGIAHRGQGPYELRRNLVQGLTNVRTGACIVPSS
jgi:hypothetical protein